MHRLPYRVLFIVRLGNFALWYLSLALVRVHTYELETKGSGLEHSTTEKEILVPLHQYQTISELQL